MASSTRRCARDISGITEVGTANARRSRSRVQSASDRPLWTPGSVSVTGKSARHWASTAPGPWRHWLSVRAACNSCARAAKRATDVCDAIIDILKPYAVHVHTITADNASEFVEDQKIAKALKADVCFAHPYSSWERRLNENSNGLLRQYIPKGADLRTITDE